MLTFKIERNPNLKSFRAMSSFGDRWVGTAFTREEAYSEAKAYLHGDVSKFNLCK